MLRDSNASFGQMFLKYSRLWIQVSIKLRTSPQTYFSFAGHYSNKDEIIFQSSSTSIFRIQFLSILISLINNNTDQIQLILSHLISAIHKMIKTLQRLRLLFSTRKQNFFQLNPIYPSFGEKDFDIYNYEKKNIKVVDGFQRQFNHEIALKEKVIDQFIRAKYIPKEKEIAYDPDTGLPLGISEDYDAFISVFKQKVKLGATIFQDYGNLQESLFQKFKVKSQFQLIKLFRISIANSQKNTIKDYFRALVMQEAIYKVSLDRNNLIGFLEKESKKLLNEKLEDIQLRQKNLKNKAEGVSADQQSKSLSQSSGAQQSEKQSNILDEKQFEESLFEAILNNIDKKIADAEQKIRRKAITKYQWRIPDYHPEFGPRIREESYMNPNLELNSPIGHGETKKTSNEERYTLNTTQDAHIRSRINKLYYLRRLNTLNEFNEIDSESIIRANELPMQIRQKDKIINQLAHKYKEYDLIVQPDLQEIYNEIDIALSKMDIKITPNTSLSEQRYAKDQRHFVKEKVLAKEQMLWESLDLDEAFSIGEYDEEHLKSVTLNHKEVKQLSTRQDVQMSLAKVPFNLYRHSDLQIFGIFTKHRSKIMKDYLKDESYLPHEEFQSFSLVKAQEELKKAKRVQIKDESCIGKGKRKTSEAEVIIKKGAGKVTINGKRLEDYFADVYHRAEALKPLAFTNTSGIVDLQISVVGGGAHGQSECISIALANGLIKMNPNFQGALYAFGLVGTDDRKKQPKRIGLYSARVRPPYVRR